MGSLRRLHQVKKCGNTGQRPEDGAHNKNMTCVVREVRRSCIRRRNRKMKGQFCYRKSSHGRSVFLSLTNGCNVTGSSSFQSHIITWFFYLVISRLWQSSSRGWNKNGKKILKLNHFRHFLKCSNTVETGLPLRDMTCHKLFLWQLRRVLSQVIHAAYV